MAASLGEAGISPNAISWCSVLCAAWGAAALALSDPVGVRFGDWALVVALLLGTVAILGRVLCNLFDGMVAVEGGKSTPSGGIHNELPDRISDVLFFVAAGYAIGEARGVVLGWLAAVLAVVAAYIRELGASQGAGHVFLGPMAKQHRMATLAAGLLAAAVAVAFDQAALVLTFSLAVIAVGTLLTCVRRTREIIRRLEATG